MSACSECSTSQQTVVRLAPGISVLTGENSHRLFVSLPGLRSDPAQLGMNLSLCQGGAIAIVNLQLKELKGENRFRGKKKSSQKPAWSALGGKIRNRLRQIVARVM